MVRPDGSFEATVPAPTAKLRKTIGFLASVAGLCSVAFKLNRPFQVVGETRVRGGVRVTAALARRNVGGTKVKIERHQSCTARTLIHTPKLDRRGRFTDSLQAAPGTIAYYRATVHPKRAPTFTLDIPLRG